MSSIMSDPITQSASNTVAQSLLPTKRTMTPSAAAATTPTNATTASTSADITSNDFLTLLVTEMQNQDPTQPTDPQAYIQQLVGVNSLQQLISINQGLTTIEPTQTTATPSAISSVSGISSAAQATSLSSSTPNAAASNAAVMDAISNPTGNF
jgi:flagellar basal-body rod modification protein FlgD